MHEFNHWQPVFQSKKLKKQPASVTVCGRDIVLFRRPSGVVGALDDTSGHATSPDNRGMPPGAMSYDVEERYGQIWLKARGANAQLPDLHQPGFVLCDTAAHNLVKAPLELCLDNFAEMEHTPTTHTWLGFDSAALANVEQKIVTTDETITGRVEGRQRKIPKVLELLLGIRTGDIFTDTWTHYFSPIYSVYAHQWLDPTTRKPRPMQSRIAVFMTPVNSQKTLLVTFSYLPESLASFRPVLQPIIDVLSQYEVGLDQRMIENIADKNPDLRGMKLGRFDKPLGELRTRIQRIYRGHNAEVQAPLTAAGA